MLLSGLFYIKQQASAVVKTADNAIKITTTAIAVKPKPRLDALLINQPQIIFVILCP
jgi:hypothetical protein